MFSVFLSVVGSVIIFLTQISRWVQDCGYMWIKHLQKCFRDVDFPRLQNIFGKCLSNVWPVAEVTSRRRLRSSSSSALLVPVTRCTTLGDRAFAVAGPRAWNTLPDFITDCSSSRTFKQYLKTYLFSLSFWAHNNTLFYDCVKRPSSSLCRLRRFKMSILHYITFPFVLCLNTHYFSPAY